MSIDGQLTMVGIARETLWLLQSPTTSIRVPAVYWATDNFIGHTKRGDELNEVVRYSRFIPVNFTVVVLLPGWHCVVETWYLEREPEEW